MDLMRVESDLTGGGATIFTSPEEIKFEMATIVEVLEDNTGKLTQNQFSMMKNIYIIVKELFYIPKKLQLAVSSMMKVKSLQAGEYLINEEDKHPDAFIIAQGTFYSYGVGESTSSRSLLHWWRKVSKNPDHPTQMDLERLHSLLTPGKCTGDFYIVSNTKWRGHRVLCLENSKAIYVPLESIERKIKEMITVGIPPEILSFLEKVIPDFHKLNVRYKDKIISCFRVKEYITGSTIIKEGLPSKYAYFIMEGECKIMSEQSIIEKIEKDKCDTNNIVVDTTLQGKRGYLSNTISHYQLGSITANQVFGEDFLILDSGTYFYTVVANTKVKCLELSKEDFTLIPKETLDHFKLEVYNRHKWIESRKIQLYHSLGKIIQIEPQQINFSENLREFKHKYPKANADILNSFRKKEISKMIQIEAMNSTQFTQPLPASINKQESNTNSIMSQTSAHFINKTEIQFDRTLWLRNKMGTQNVDTSNVKSPLLNKVQLTHAASSKVACIILHPTTSRWRKKKQTALLPTVVRPLFINPLRSSDVEEDFKLKNLCSFRIGKKDINLLSDQRRLLITPNPFEALAKRKNSHRSVPPQI